MKKKIVITLVCVIAVITAAVILFMPGDTYEEHYDRGKQYLDEGNYEEAINEFTAAIKMDDKKSEAFLGSAKAYLYARKEGFYQDAIDAYECALKLDNKITDAYLGIADIYCEQGNEDKLASVLNKALENVFEEDLKEIVEYINSLNLKREERLKILKISGENKEPLYNIEKERIVKKLKKEKTKIEKALVGYCWANLYPDNWAMCFETKEFGLETIASAPSGAWRFNYEIYYDVGTKKDGEFDIAKIDNKLYLKVQHIPDEMNTDSDTYVSEIALVDEKRIKLHGKYYERYNSFEEVFREAGYF